MRDIDIDLEAGRAAFSVPKSLYGLDGLRIAAQVFAARAQVLLSETRDRYELTLKARRLPAGDLEALAREFLNELLNQEYRFLVGRFNRKISSLIVSQALLSARGGETPAAPSAEEQTPEFQASVASMMREAEEEIRRTMPRKIPPQGAPLPPAAEGTGV